MEALWTAVAIAIVGVVLIGHIRWQRSNAKLKQLPPGPPKLPIIGNMHQILKGGDLLHTAMSKLAKVHGPLMTIWLGSRPTIVVSDHDLAWEVLVSKSPDFADRYIPNLLKFFTNNHQTIATSNAGAHWHSLRRGLQNSAVGPVGLFVQAPLQESDMVQLIKDMMDEASLNEGFVKPFHHIRRNAIRLIARLCFGPDFSNDDKFETSMDDLCEEIMKFGEVARVVDAIPLARFFPRFRRTLRREDKLKQWIVELVGRHLSSPPPSNCFAHFLLSQQSYSLELAIMSIFEVFFFGIDAIGSTTMWALALIVSNQEAQQKLYEEIRDNTTLTEKGIVKVDEVGKLEYLQAVMKETMRMKPIAPLAVPHRVSKDTVVNGMHVAKGTMLMVNLYAMNYDPKVWDEPYRFSPERFLETSNKAFQAEGKRRQHFFIPFGAGMRACAGMDVGKLQFAFTAANLIKAFHWSSAVEGEMPDLSEDQALVMTMKNPLKARILPRAT